MDNKENKNPFDEKKCAELVGNFVKNFVCICNECAKKDVCKFIDNPPLQCKNFLNSGNYKRYGNLNDLFQPIFDWLKYHYPSNEVKFFVDNNRAMMLIDHMCGAYSKEITQNPYLMWNGKDTKEEQEGNEK